MLLASPISRPRVLFDLFRTLRKAIFDKSSKRYRLLLDCAEDVERVTCISHQGSIADRNRSFRIHPRAQPFRLAQRRKQFRSLRKPSATRERLDRSVVHLFRFVAFRAFSKRGPKVVV